MNGVDYSASMPHFVCMKRNCREEENFIGYEGTEKRTMKDKKGCEGSVSIACPKYPESKDRVPKSFSFIPRTWVFRLAPRCCMHLSSNNNH